MLLILEEDESKCELEVSGVDACDGICRMEARLLTLVLGLLLI